MRLHRLEAVAFGPFADQVSGVTEWHVNADEVPLFDYNDDLLEVLSRNGDGRYGFVNTPEAASSESLP